MSLDNLWKSPWGDRYHQRNMSAFSSSKRSRFWERFYKAHPVASVLEIGCGSGANLRWARAASVYGMDVNEKAVAIANSIPGVVVAEQSIFDKRFADGFAELVFTCGVLIHIERARLEVAISEMIRLSSKYVMAMEYEADKEEPILYHGQANALWKRPYRALISLRLGAPLAGGFLTARQGFDRVTWSLWPR